jgi:hypothetical protein
MDEAGNSSFSKSAQTTRSQSRTRQGADRSWTKSDNLAEYREYYMQMLER